MKLHVLGLVDLFSNFMFSTFLELSEQNHTFAVLYHSQAFNKCLIMFTINGLTVGPNHSGFDHNLNY